MRGVSVNLFFSFAQATAKGFVLIQTKEVSMRPEDVKRVFQNSAEDLVEWTSKGTRNSSAANYKYLKATFLLEGNFSQAKVCCCISVVSA